MKYLSTIINIIFGIAICILFYLHFGNKPKEINTNTTVLKDTIQYIKPEIKEKTASVVFVNSDTLFSRYEQVKDVKKELELKKNIAEKEFGKRYKSLEEEYNLLKDRAATISQEEGMAKQQELMGKEQKLGEFRDQQTELLLKQEQDKNEAIQKTIIEYLNRNYSNTSYTYILGYSRGGGILYAQNSLDITEEVLKGLNAEYMLNKKGKK